jgi:hypothetical protein
MSFSRYDVIMEEPNWKLLGEGGDESYIAHRCPKRASTKGEFAPPHAWYWHVMKLSDTSRQCWFCKAFPPGDIITVWALHNK